MYKKYDGVPKTLREAKFLEIDVTDFTILGARREIWLKLADVVDLSKDVKGLKLGFNLGWLGLLAILPVAVVIFVIIKVVKR